MTQRKYEECLSKAGFDARSARMEKGLDTWLYKDCDADGVSISGGEEQKIALARGAVSERGISDLG